MAESRIRLFISHSERDEVLVRPLYQWLQSGLGLNDEEIRCTSVENIDVGDPAITKLRDDMEAAQVVVGLLTSHSLRSHWVGIEMGASWLKQRLFGVRGPGMRPQDLPTPIRNFVTVGYCENKSMGRMLERLAALIQVQANQQAEFDLGDMVSKAEEYTRSQIRGWFELPPVLSAWRLNETKFTASLRARLKDLHIRDDRDRQELEECAAPTGLIMRDPVSLPSWARDHWTLSKLTVNHLLTGTGTFAKIPHSILDEQLTADLLDAWTTAGPQRGRLLHEWMENASSYVVQVQNLPLDARGH